MAQTIRGHKQQLNNMPSNANEKLREILKKARLKNAKLKKEGKLPHPTKEWSKESLKSLQAALSGGKGKNYTTY
jgi:hypothetical protein